MSVRVCVCVCVCVCVRVGVRVAGGEGPRRGEQHEMANWRGVQLQGVVICRLYVGLVRTEVATDGLRVEMAMGSILNPPNSIWYGMTVCRPVPNVPGAVRGLAGLQPSFYSRTPPPPRSPRV